MSWGSVGGRRDLAFGAPSRIVLGKKTLALRAFGATFALKPGELNMTAAQVHKDDLTIAAYAVTARRMANCARTHCRGAATATIERRSGTGTERHDVGYAPSEAWARRSV